MPLVVASLSDRAKCREMVDAIWRETERAAAIIKRPGWSACPFEEGGGISPAYAHRIARTASASGDGTLWISTAGVTARVFAADAREQAITQARAALSTDDVWLVAPSGRWLVLASEAEFGVVLGESDLVEALLGFPVPQAVPRFTEYVRSWQAPSRAVLAVSASSWSEYGALDDGGELVIRWK